MKKLLSLIVAALLVLSLPVLAVSAAYEAELAVSKTEAKAGETAEILITVTNNPGLCALGFEIEFDKEALKVISAEFTEMFSDASKRVNTQDGKILFNAASADNINGDGTVAKITFKVLSEGEHVITAKPLGEQGFVLHSEADHSIHDVTLNIKAGHVAPPAPVTDAPVTDAPVTDAPVTDAPETELPVTDAPVTACTHGKTVSETVKASTCNTNGVAIIRCVDCGISLGETELPLAEHTAGGWTTESADAGETVQKCTVCGEILARNPITTEPPATSVPSGGDVQEPADEGGSLVVILVIIVAVIAAGGLVFFYVMRSKADRSKQEREYF